LLAALEKHAQSVEVQCTKEKVGETVYSVQFSLLCCPVLTNASLFYVC